MKLVQELTKYVSLVGLRELRPGEMSPFNRRNVGVLLIFVLLSISSTAVIWFDDETVQDYTESMFALISLVFNGLGVLVNIMKSNEFFDLIKDFENTIEMRESLTMRH